MPRQTLPTRTCSCSGSALPKRPPCCAISSSRSSVKKVGVDTLPPAPSMGSSAEVSGKSNSGPADAAVAGAGVPLPSAALLRVPAAPSAAAARAGMAGAPSWPALLCPSGCCRERQLLRTALSTAASDGSWNWQLRAGRRRRGSRSGAGHAPTAFCPPLARLPPEQLQNDREVHRHNKYCRVGPASHPPDPGEPCVTPVNHKLQRIAGAAAGGCSGGRSRRLGRGGRQVWRQVGQRRGCSRRGRRCGRIRGRCEQDAGEGGAAMRAEICCC